MGFKDFFNEIDDNNSFYKESVNQQVPSINTQKFTDHRGEWNVGALIRYAQKHGQRKKIPIAKLLHNLDDKKGSTVMGGFNSKEFQARAHLADRTYPILVVDYNGEYWVADGNHRLWVAHRQGEKTIDAFIIDADQMDRESDRIDSYEE